MGEPEIKTLTIWKKFSVNTQGLSDVSLSAVGISAAV